MPAEGVVGFGWIIERVLGVGGLGGGCEYGVFWRVVETLRSLAGWERLWGGEVMVEFVSGFC